MNYRFRPTWIPSLVTLLLLPILLGLGFWQLDRAQQKKALQDDYDRRSSGAVQVLDAQPRAAEALRFYKVSARGYYEPAYQILLDNRVHRGRVGYYVITPLRIEGSAMRILVNRGWVPLGHDRSVLPAAPAPGGIQEAVGIASVPAKRVFGLGARPGQGTAWEPVWQYMDMEQYLRAVPFSVQPVVMLLDPRSEAGGFVREWGRLDSGIATHRGYAFQWFTLAFALLSIYLFVNVRKEGKTPQ